MKAYSQHQGPTINDCVPIEADGILRNQKKDGGNYQRMNEIHASVHTFSRRVSQKGQESKSQGRFKRRPGTSWQRLPLCFLVLSLIIQPSLCFVTPNHIQHRSRHCRPLQSIGDWRDLIFDYPGTGDDRRLGTEQYAPPREINILPFPFDQCLLQGETKQLRLYEERFIKLFEDTMENHCGVVAMGMLANSGIIQKVPLCEIEAFNRMDGFGIFVTIRAVGRAELLEVTQQEPYIKAVCVEVSDKIPPNLELPNILAKNIRESLKLLSSMEKRLKEADGDNDKDSGKLSQAMLEDKFYAEDDDDDDNDDNDNADNDVEMDKEGRFKTAYKVALSTDSQGYCLSSTDAAGGYTPQELTATSWAAFSTEGVPEKIATFRIQALDCDDLFDRLKLASHMLKQQRAELEAKMVKAGIKLEDDGDNEEENNKQD